MVLSDLKELKMKGVPVSVYSDRYDIECFSFGFITNIDNDFVYINHITPNGEQDGLVLRKIKEIFKIEYGGEYENKLINLYKLKKQEHKSYFDKSLSDGFNSLIRYIVKNKIIVTIAFGDIDNYSEATGFIERIENEKIYIKEVSFDARILGNLIINKNDILKLNCDTKEESDISLLFESNSM